MLRNAIRAEAPEDEEEFKIAQCAGGSELIETRREFGAGRVVRRVSAGTQVGATVRASTEEFPEWFDWWWQAVVDCSGVLGLLQEERVQRVAQRGAARRQRTTSAEARRERMR